jgi:hypothetical protein
LLLAWFVVRAHLALLTVLPTLLKQRRRVRAQARISPDEFVSLAARFSITPEQVAAQ